MATIDKSLPNVNQDLVEPTAADVEQNIIDQKTGGPVDVTENEDGSADINLEPQSNQPQQPADHFANLAELLEDKVLGPIGSELCDDFDQYKTSRQDWEKSYTDGLDLLGFKYERRTEPFKGASGATHPVLAEAVTQFQAQAYKELLPADGPVRTQIIGAGTVQREQEAQRVKEFMNIKLWMS